MFFIMNGDTATSSFMVSPLFHYTVSRIFYVNCLFIKYFLISFPIDMREMCERPVSRCISLFLSGNWGNYIVHGFFNGRYCHILIKQNCVTLFV